MDGLIAQTDRTMKGRAKRLRESQVEKNMFPVYVFHIAKPKRATPRNVLYKSTILSVSIIITATHVHKHTHAPWCESGNVEVCKERCDWISLF